MGLAFRHDWIHNDNPCRCGGIGRRAGLKIRKTGLFLTSKNFQQSPLDAYKISLESPFDGFLTDQHRIQELPAKLHYLVHYFQNRPPAQEIEAEPRTSFQ